MSASVIASLDARTNSATVLAPRNEHVKGTDNLTGQWLYDRFIGNDQAELTKMGIVRGVLLKYDTASVKQALKEMVEIAKAAGPAQLKTAQNHQSVMRAVYGALKFAPDQLKERGIDPSGAITTGYHVMKVHATEALKARGVKWDGTRVKSEEEKKAAANTAIAQAATNEVMAQNPQLAGESFQDWMGRIQGAIQNRIDATSVEAKAEAVEKLADKVIAMCGPSFAEVLALLVQRQMSEAEDQPQEQE